MQVSFLTRATVGAPYRVMLMEIGWASFSSRLVHGASLAFPLGVLGGAAPWRCGKGTSNLLLLLLLQLVPGPLAGMVTLHARHLVSTL